MRYIVQAYESLSARSASCRARRSGPNDGVLRGWLALLPSGHQSARPPPPAPAMRAAPRVRSGARARPCCRIPRAPPLPRRSPPRCAAAAQVTTSTLRYQPPGAERALLRGVELRVPAGALHVVCGRSGSGKSTLLHCLAGLSAPTEGEVAIGDARADAARGAAEVAAVAGACRPQPRAPRVGLRALCSPLTSRPWFASSGLVFQFPERHWLGKTIADELTFGWPRGAAAWEQRRRLGAQVRRVWVWVWWVAPQRSVSI